ncbi:MAG: RnfABCDGE type electron transport complex subunit D [Candidatus Omnitrophota bacterium]
MNNAEKLIVTASPHIYSTETVAKIMWTVVIALLPAGGIGVVLFGTRALWVIAVAIAVAGGTEVIIQRLRNKSATIYDGSAVLAGLLLAYNLPPGIPLWMVALGAVAAIGFGKHIFGGLGHNLFNPALIGRVFLLASFPQEMTAFSAPWAVDGIARPTPLGIVKEKGIQVLNISYGDLFIGNRGGCIGEVCILALILGAIYLLYKGYISWHIPLSFISTGGFLVWVYGGKGIFSGDIIFHILSGGLILGAFFMATDYVTSPLTNKGKLIFGTGCGALTAVIRLWGGYPEGVSYAILIMNAFTPLIDKFTTPKKFGR